MAETIYTAYSQDKWFRYIQHEAHEFLKDAFVFQEEIADLTDRNEMRAAGVLLRAQFEGAVEARLLFGCNNDGLVHEAINMKDAHFHNDAYEKARRMKNPDPIEAQALAEAGATVEQYRQIYGWRTHPKHWSQLGLERRAKETRMHAMYQKIYGVLSWDAHYTSVPRMRRLQHQDDLRLKAHDAVKFMSTSAELLLLLLGGTRRYLPLGTANIDEIEQGALQIIGATSRLA